MTGRYRRVAALICFVCCVLCSTLSVTAAVADQEKRHVILSLIHISLQDINLGTIAKLKEQAGIHSDIISDVLDTVAETMGQDEDIRIYTSGTTNLFKYPELSDSTEKASELISTFEEKQQLASLVTENLLEDKSTGIQVYIGNESPIQTMKDCSVVTATYELGEGIRGTIGIVGPKRMDYEKVMDNLKVLKNSLDGILDRPKGET